MGKHAWRMEWYSVAQKSKDHVSPSPRRRKWVIIKREHRAQIWKVDAVAMKGDSNCPGTGWKKSHSTDKEKHFTFYAVYYSGREKKKYKAWKITREASSQDWILQIINNCCDPEVLGTSRASDYTICRLNMAKEVKGAHRHIYILNLERSTSEISNKHLLICKKETQSLQKRFRCQWQKQ